MSNEETKPDPMKIMEAVKAMHEALAPLDKVSRERAVRTISIILEINRKREPR